MTDTQDLIDQLRLGASISRDRNLNLDFVKVADQAADKLEAAQAENAELRARLAEVEAGASPVQPSQARELTDAEIGRIAIESQQGISPHDDTIRFARAIIAAINAKAVQPSKAGWLPIESAPKHLIVIVYYKNSHGHGRTMRASYYPPETLESDTTESGWADEGWYEESEVYEYLMPLDGEPTHWMPLPAAPSTKEGQP